MKGTFAKGTLTVWDPVIHMCKILSHYKPWTLLMLLERDGTQYQMELAMKTGLYQGDLSRHFHRLIDAGLISVETKATKRYYAITSFGKAFLDLVKQPPFKQLLSDHEERLEELATLAKN